MVWNWVWTSSLPIIGYGHVEREHERTRFADGIDEATAEDLLRRDVETTGCAYACSRRSNASVSSRRSVSGRRKHEVEAPNPAIRTPAQVEQEIFAKDSVLGVLVRQIGKEELAGEEARGRTLDLDVDVRRTPCVANRPDSLESKRAEASVN